MPSLVGVLLAAQAAGASVAGVVRDGDRGLPLPGVQVSLPDLARTTVTDAQGRYSLSDVPAGPQHVVVRLIGYSQQRFHALVPRHGTLDINVELRRVAIELRPIEALAGVTVPPRGLDDGDGPNLPDRSLSQAAVRDHPLLAEPDLLPAVGGGAVVLDPEAPSGIHVRGGASDQIAYLLDGIPVFSPYHSAGTYGAWNPDAVSRLDLFASQAVRAFPGALSGSVSATTRAPGAVHETQGSVSVTQARLTVDGPLAGGAGYLLSVRSAFPGLLVHPREASYLRGEGGDRLGKIELPLLAGRLRLLGYENENEIATTASESAATRNAFGWDSRSVGGDWTRRLGAASVELRAWRAVLNASALWTASDSGDERLVATSQEAGLGAQVEFEGGRTRTALGARAQRGRARYRAGTLDLDVRTPVAAAFLEHERPLASRGSLALSLVATAAAGRSHVDPGAHLRWRFPGGWIVSGGFERRHQFAQSLRNAESVVGAIFPVDLTVGAGGEGVPVARSDIGAVAIEYHPGPGVRLGAQAFARSFGGLALVAPQDAQPFAVSGFLEGTGTARGLSVDLAANGARYGAIASYGLQRARLAYGDTSYVPVHGTAHTLDVGVIVYPSPSAAVRLGLSGAFGRRATAVTGPFEWEACNLLDQGCEFAGSPGGGGRSEPLGATALPAYLRVDAGVRKHWHLKLAGRDGLVAVFGTVTNLLGRQNVLTVVVDPATGERRQVTMRPRAPLVVGFDWRF